MRQLQLAKAFTLMESGPVVLVTTNDGERNNVMTISWTMVVDFTPTFEPIFFFSGRAMVRMMATSRPSAKPSAVPVSAINRVMPVPRRNSIPYFSSKKATQPKKDVEAFGILFSFGARRLAAPNPGRELSSLHLPHPDCFAIRDNKNDLLSKKASHFFVEMSYLPFITE